MFFITTTIIKFNLIILLLENEYLWKHKRIQTQPEATQETGHMQWGQQWGE